ncbi:cysteine-rich CWC family protein [Pandoraea nosoerga]|uniref:cysteine-rich CWC family protein n=2 Tax=Pandoraea TaxID=93217 RepID=UPI001240E8EF|nr:cysteine-rich CWC family protein [Pandoraea nosoerga]MBN4667315.1 cysteine-rich CWC family protein [Pandoraea nosoerga]MBN4676556.1 cysteine-rich CWC family protein [Pandoraea nosoerga]MBN4682118.1 cysteine-rich CWC family protein [Pandoraea nosoerga]MBN4743513.1 cysteine-rich CWC family protein [Pandoraea nosoerga]
MIDKDVAGKREGAAAAAGDAPQCPRCGAAVRCGAALSPNAHEVRCWCLDWPHLPVLARTGALACLCPACLRTALLDAGVAIDGTAADRAP